MPEEAGIALPVYTDSHAHLSLVEDRLGRSAISALFSAFAAGWDSAANSGKESQAPFMVDIGTKPGDLESRIGHFGSQPFVRFSAGLWPGGESLEKPRESLEALERDLESARCCALGECGLDYHHMEASRSVQMKLFEAQIALAVEKGFPLVVHSREALEDTLAVVSGAASFVPVIIHCFSYSEASAERFLERGCLLSFAGNITYKKSDELQRALKATPTDRLLMETDSPYMNPMPYRGKPGTSLDIARTIEYAARLKGMTVENLASAAQANAFRIFSGREIPSHSAAELS